MVTAITEGVKVSVETNYQPEYSSPTQMHYVFTYRITIENHGQYSVKIQRRHWYIHDVNNTVREVEGEGIVGQQPILEPGETHQYVSGCNLRSGLGKMYGNYLMEKVMDGKTFNVIIPEFTMVVPYILN